MRFIQYRGIKRGNKRKAGTTKKNLVIVVSPAKAKTINSPVVTKVMASVGHIQDLKKSTMSVGLTTMNRSINDKLEKGP